MVACRHGGAHIQPFQHGVDLSGAEGVDKVAVGFCLRGGGVLGEPLREESFLGIDEREGGGVVMLAGEIEFCQKLNSQLAPMRNGGAEPVVQRGLSRLGQVKNFAWRFGVLGLKGGFHQPIAFQFGEQGIQLRLFHAPDRAERGGVFDPLMQFVAMHRAFRQIAEQNVFGCQGLAGHGHGNTR